jgi:hypothetical protein
MKLLDQEARVEENASKEVKKMKKIRRSQCADHNWSYEYQMGSCHDGCHRDTMLKAQIHLKSYK